MYCWCWAWEKSKNRIKMSKFLWLEPWRVIEQTKHPCRVLVRALPKVPRGRARRSRATPRSGFPTSRGTGDGHLEAHHDLQATPARPGKVTRLGVRGSIVPAAYHTSDSSFFREGVRDLFSAKGSCGADLTRHNLTIHPIPMICAYRYDTPTKN